MSAPASTSAVKGPIPEDTQCTSAAVAPWAADGERAGASTRAVAAEAECAMHEDVLVELLEEEDIEAFVYFNGVLLTAWP